MRPSARSGRDLTTHLLLCCIFFPPTQLLYAVWRTLTPATPACCVINVLPQRLASVSHIKHPSRVTVTGCRIVWMFNVGEGDLGLCVCLFVSSLTWVSMLNDPSLTPTGTPIAPNRFAVTLWSMRIPTTDWCVSWRRRCLAWKISSVRRAWVTSLRVREHYWGVRAILSIFSNFRFDRFLLFVWKLFSMIHCQSHFIPHSPPHNIVCVNVHLDRVRGN